jgi:hypothetical protein
MSIRKFTGSLSSSNLCIKIRVSPWAGMNRPVRTMSVEWAGIENFEEGATQALEFGDFSSFENELSEAIFGLATSAEKVFFVEKLMRQLPIGEVLRDGNVERWLFFIRILRQRRLVGVISLAKAHHFRALLFSESFFSSSICGGAAQAKRPESLSIN